MDRSSTLILVPKYLLSAKCSQGLLTALILSKINIIPAKNELTAILRNIPRRRLHTKQNIFCLTHAKTYLNFENCARLGYYAVPFSGVKILTPDDGTDMVSQNIGKKSPLLAA
jgi:hypothetical protein